MKLLLEHGADPNIKNKYGRTPLYEAAYWGNVYVMKESGELEELDIELWISKVGKGIVYFLEFDNVER